MCLGISRQCLTADIGGGETPGVSGKVEGAVAAAEVVAICDIDNTLFGPSGAAVVFAPQKGATAEQVGLLDAGLAHVADVIARDLGDDVRDVRGGGAAGGMGAGLRTFLGAELRSGVDTVPDVVGFNTLLSGADLVITGEGSFDSQSLGGKLISGLARRCQTADVPLVVLAGRAAPDAAAAAPSMGIIDVVCVNPPDEPTATSMARAAVNIRAAVAARASHWLPALGRLLAGDRVAVHD